ncbi:hypothetical protein IFO70_33540 [Phormidium tenue FACHB-886]|nr:hypothetical protein [Phormidium tenue FACHB-886]
MKVAQTLRFFGFLLTTSFILNGCGSNSSIESAQKFGELATEFENNTNKLADDIYDSCVRRIQYIQVDTERSNQARNEALAQCETFNKAVSQQAKDANSVVTDYVTAIGKLASDDVVSFDAQFERIKTSLSNFSIPVEKETATGTEIVSVTLPPTAITTGTSIANFIFGWASNQFRQGTLREAITCTDRPLNTYITGLEHAFRAGYVEGLLNQELFRVNSYYDYYAALLRTRGGSDEEFRRLQNESYNAIATVLQRRNAAVSYMAILDKTASAHAALAKLFLGNQTPPSESSCINYLNADQLDTTLFNSQGWQVSESRFTVEELAQIRQIAATYQAEVKPLLIQMDKALEDQP